MKWITNYQISDDQLIFNYSASFYPVKWPELIWFKFSLVYSHFFKEDTIQWPFADISFSTVKSQNSNNGFLYYFHGQSWTFARMFPFVLLHLSSISFKCLIVSLSILSTKNSVSIILIVVNHCNSEISLPSIIFIYPPTYQCWLFLYAWIIF